MNAICHTLWHNSPTYFCKLLNNLHLNLDGSLGAVEITGRAAQPPCGDQATSLRCRGAAFHTVAKQWITPQTAPSPGIQVFSGGSLLKADDSTCDNES